MFWSVALQHFCGNLSAAKIDLACEGQLKEDDMRRRSFKLVLAAGMGLGALGLGGKSAPAMPMSGLDPALATPADLTKNVEPVRWVCGPYRCHRVHGWHRRYWWGPGYGFYGPGPWWRYGYGYHPWWRLRYWWPPYRYGYYW
jgi:hypothetical protein